MAEIEDQEITDFVAKYKQRLSSQLDVGEEDLKPVDPNAGPSKIKSKDYKQFQKENMAGHMGTYEKACNWAENLLKLPPSPKAAPQIQDDIDTCHLNITPTGANTLALLSAMTIVIFGAGLAMLALDSMFFTIFFLVAGGAVMVFLKKLPGFLAGGWRMKASNSMVLCIFYVVTYMRHTSNLEKAIEFGADHLPPPLSTDLKRVLWDVETAKYESIRESLDAYLDGWRKYNMEFVEAFHLIESSLFESENKRRIELLDKSLDVILSETYEKMLHYAHNLKSPITMLHMMGIILPILGLVILPLMVSFMEGVGWYHISTLYNVVIPVAVYMMGKNILATRPCGYGDTDISENNPELKKYKTKEVKIAGKTIRFTPLFYAIVTFTIFFLIGTSPITMHWLGVKDRGIMAIDDPDRMDTPCHKQICLLEYKCPKKAGDDCKDNERIGPFGLGSTMLGVCITLAFGLGISTYFARKSGNIIKIREKSKELEKEFGSALFQLGNRLGDGLPAEIAFAKVSETMKDTISGKFFQAVSMNISRLGMGIEDALFNPKTGAMVSFPSKLIESSMKVLVQSAKKGPKVASTALINIARYIKEIHKVDERLKDLMADITGSMYSQVKFMSPMISGIVVGITAMITLIITRLSSQISKISDTASAGGGAGAGSLKSLAMFGDGIPAYYFLIVVGLYVVELGYVLIVLANGIENGQDKIGEQNKVGTMLKKSTMKFVMIGGTVTILFSMIAAKILARG